MFAVAIGKNRVGEESLCSVCDYELDDDDPKHIVKRMSICPECGANLLAPGAIARGRRMSPEARARMYWFVFVMWALSTALWLWLVL